MNSKTTVVYHRADYDGIFCREIARKFLPDAELIGWDYGDAPIMVPPDSQKLVVMDLPLDAPFGFKWDKEIHSHQFFPGEVVWIDHHKSSIESHPKSIPGYRIDGVAACRLAWQWFTHEYASHVPGNQIGYPLPTKEQFVALEVNEPMAVRLAGEYDIWDKRDPDAEVFQFGLRSKEMKQTDWSILLLSEAYTGCQHGELVDALLRDGRTLQRYQQEVDTTAMQRSFTVEFEGLKFLALNSVRFNSLTFASKDQPYNDHVALLGFYWTGAEYAVSLYHSKHHMDLDLSVIAVKHGGGGHRGACGFRAKALPFINAGGGK